MNIIGAVAIRSGFTLLGAALVAYDVFKGTEWQLPSFLDRDEVSQTVTPPERDEIRNYVQFIQVAWTSGEIFTGIQYGSDRNRQIERQWCYVIRTASNGRKMQLTLATKDGIGALLVPEFSQTALADFDLTRVSARALTTSHCRFQ